MKRTLLRKLICLVTCSVCTTALHAQWFDWMSYYQTFDDTLRFDLSIDTTDGHGGLWRIGTPQKTVFNGPQSPPNVIVTDTVQPYPPSDTSRFTITHLAQYGWSSPHTAILEGYVWADTDQGDSGRIEISFDQGSTWSDLLNDTVVASYLQWSGSTFPTLNGSTGGWQYFSMFLSPLHDYAANELGIMIEPGDSIQYRFTFMSDSVDTPHDGLMYDGFYFQDWIEAIPEYQASVFHSAVAPDPVSDRLYMTYATAGVLAPVLTVYDAHGTVCLKNDQLPLHHFSTDVSALAVGLYSYELRSQNGKRSFGRFMKQ